MSCNKTQQVLIPKKDLKEEHPNTQLSQETQSNVPSDAQIIVEESLLVKRGPNYKALTAVALAVLLVIAAKYYYDERQELNITPPLDWRRHVIPRSAWWSNLEPHQQESFARYSIEHFYNTAWTEEPRPRWKKPPSRKMAVEMRWDLMIEG